jgi:predicted nucleic-acid-binding protein
VIAVDTNVLARFYVADPEDSEAEKQRERAWALFSGKEPLFVPLTVTLELEWVLRAHYGFSAKAFGAVLDHLVHLPNVSVERSADVLEAAKIHLQGLDFADALHLRGSAKCNAFATFDDRKFARRAAKLGLMPPVELLGKH